MRETSFFFYITFREKKFYIIVLKNLANRVKYIFHFSLFVFSLPMTIVIFEDEIFNYHLMCDMLQKILPSCNILEPISTVAE